MKTKLSAIILVVAALLAGCSSRSISNSGYHADSTYVGELNELEVLGVRPDAAITDAMISDALSDDQRIALRRGSRVVLIQSGAYFPDDAMMTAAGKYYDIVPLSGIPPNGERRHYYRQQRNEDGFWTTQASDGEVQPIDKALRLAAARAGAQTLVVYWGVLETEREGYATKAVSWVPLVGDFIPDEDQETRIRLKAAVIDVSTGSWDLLTPEVYSDERTTIGANRQSSDQRQVNLLKEKAYDRLVADLQTRYGY